MYQIQWSKTPNITKWVQNKQKYIVLHHTASDNSDWDLRTLTTPRWDKSVSAHFLVVKSWLIYQLANYNEVTWHAGKSKYGQDVNLNDKSIGIEVTGWVSDSPDSFTNEQRQSVFYLIQKIIFDTGIEPINILRHKDIDDPDGRKVDIYDSFWNTDFKNFPEYKLQFLPPNYKQMSKYEPVFKSEVKEPLFGSHDWNIPLTESDVKYLIEIAINRDNKRDENLFTRLLNKFLPKK